MSVFDETWEAVDRGGARWHICPRGEEETATFWEEDGERPQLAAAAPDLYRALVSLLSMSDYATAESCELIREQCRAALKKARGE